MERPGILVLGADHVSLRNLVGAITNIPEPATPLTWTIDNKYYTADVLVRTLNVQELQKEIDDLPLDSDTEAIVAVVPARAQESFEAIKRWWALEDDQGYEIKLFVALNEEDNELPSWFTEATDWALENFMEVIHVHSLQRDIYPVQEKMRAEDGLPRLLEALHSHMWPGLRRKPDSRRTTGTELRDAPDDVSTLAQLTVEAFDEDVDNDEFERIFSQINGKLTSSALTTNSHIADGVYNF